MTSSNAWLLRETPCVKDRALRVALVDDIRHRATIWRLQGAKERREDDARTCRLHAAVLEELARDLEAAGSAAP